jgi:hypothetical protein
VGSVVSRNRSLGQTQGNININKGSSGVTRSTARVQTKYRLTERNPNRTATQVQRRTPIRVVKTPSRSYNRTNNRVQQSNTRNSYKSTQNYNSSGTSRSNYTRSNNSSSNTRSYSRPSNSGSSRSSYNSGSSSRSSSRGSTSSRSSGRRN